MLKGRLGLQGARVPQSDRHGLIWLGRGNLYVENGVVRFVTAGWGDLEPGDYAIPFQMVSCLVMAPGTTVSHDALRILGRHGTGIVFVGEHGVRFYAGMPFGPDNSRLARAQASAWTNPAARLQIVRRMYAWRLGEVLPASDLDALRGIEGARMKQTYRRMAEQFGIEWKGRRYDRQDPGAADIANQAINHASSAVEGAALLAVAVTGTIPQLGFVHENSGNAFALDVADLFRDDVLLPIAFGAARKVLRDHKGPVERVVRKGAARTLRNEHVVSRMIGRIKELLGGNDDRGDT